MLKNKIIVLFLIFIPLITSGQNSNLDFGSSINNSTSPPTYDLIAHYKNPTNDIMGELINLFGKSYTVRGDSYFYWEKVKVKKIGHKSLDIIIIKRVDIFGEDKHEYYDINIKKKDKQFLKEIKFWNVSKVKRIFKKFAQPI